MLLTLKFATLLFFLSVSSIYAHENDAVSLSCCTFHSVSIDGNGEKLNSVTWGIGYESGFRKFWAIGGLRNSHRNSAWYVGYGRRWLLNNDVYGLLYGGYLESDGGIPVIAPGLTIGGEDLAINFVIGIGGVKVGNEIETKDLVFLQIRKGL